MKPVEHWLTSDQIREAQRRRDAKNTLALIAGLLFLLAVLLLSLMLVG